MSGYYVASRASVPERVEMWKALRSSGVPIISTWIDEAGPGETTSFSELWERIAGEIRSSWGLVLFAEPGDFPLKGALVEVGLALGMDKRVAIIAPRVKLAGDSLRPIGSWIRHPLCCCVQEWASAEKWIKSP